MLTFGGCAGSETENASSSAGEGNGNADKGTGECSTTASSADKSSTGEGSAEIIRLSTEIMELENGLSAVKYSGDYGFEGFLSQGGASSDAEVVEFISKNLLPSARSLSFEGVPFGCSTISTVNAEGNRLFGRNFDWNKCNALIVHSLPEKGYSSISTVNTDFISLSGLKLSDLPHRAQAVICMYAPLDGMNEKGLAVSVNMIEDRDTISQNTDKPDITTTTAVRLLLDKASDADEAVSLLKEYDMHASMGFMMHIAIADATGKSVVVEYVGNEMIVTQTPVVTNFYLAEGEKHGIGTAQSKERYDLLMKIISENETMTPEDVRDALNSVSKHNFDGFESTEWSIVFNQTTGEVSYYHRENYNVKYTFSI
ncbi:MAG: linear amide C-N hydrolase [Ruminiclostridium sp.]|nr:linear amide C-N hydrolase [Ruminiclostridium sp.]